MANTKITNTFVASETIGTREDLSDLISNISPTDVPFSSNCGTRPKAKQVQYDWQLDALDAVDTTNAQPEGADHTEFQAVAPTTRVANVCQISTKDIILSDTQEEEIKAGRKSELGYQTTKRVKELKRDVEAICLTKNVGAALADPRKTATLLSYAQTNVSKAGDGANPAAPAPLYAGTRTDGTTRVFTEDILKALLVTAYNTGMKVADSVLMVSPTMKQVVSAFKGIATLFQGVKGAAATIVGAVDVYVSDFGEFSIVPNRFQRERDAWLFDFDLIGFKDLRPYRVVPLAKSGDATKKLLLREWSLQVDNEAGAIALAADLKTA